jgi:hypothetical protein
MTPTKQPRKPGRVEERKAGKNNPAERTRNSGRVEKRQAGSKERQDGTKALIE